MMQIQALLVIPLMIYQIEALECGIKTLVDRDMKKAVSSCLTRNMTAKDMYDFSNYSPEENETSTSNTEDKANQNQMSNAREMKNRRIRSTVTKKFNRQVTEITTTIQPEADTESTTAPTYPQEEKCIIQCILSRLELTNEKGFPEQEKISNILTKKAKGRELVDFLKDTTIACFQKLKEDMTDSSKDPCDFSINLVRCLADGGKSNCGDWPVGDISLFD
uniref:Odorant binding protein n=1 Tax=Hippodamia variegata TaxID=703264 RepID=A0A9E7V466_9CUCU|nr:odorant binding protein [Hippodamia variegata]